MYAVSEDGGETWTQPQPIYNGTSGGVKGIEAAMLESGEAAVVFTLQTGAHDAASGDFRQEVVYAIVDETPEGYGVTRYVQMTDNTAMDENPQITAVRLEEGDREEVFVIGWSSTSGTDEVQEKDIQLAAVDGDGNRLPGFVDSLSSLIANTGVRVNANFRFSRNADTLDQLSILWKESSVTVEETQSQAEGAAPANYDYLSGLRFRTDGGSISVTAAQRIAQMEDSTAIDSFDAYLAGDGRLISVLQGTWYDYEHPETITMNPNTRAAYSVLLPAEKTGIYLGAGSYTDTLRVDSVIPDYEHVRKGMSIPVQISLTNLGTGPMDRVEVTIGSSQRTFEAGGDSGFTAIAPGETRTLTVSYTVPASGIVDPAYSITGTFRSGTSSQAEDTLTLNVPDLGIAGSETLLAAENGQRVLRFTLYNNSDSQLAGSRRNVKFNLYSDPECTQPIPAQYFQEIAALAEDGGEALKTIGTDEDLAKIDEGYYTVQYRFDLAAYIRQTDEEGNTPYADENGEVRDGGITLYAKAWVEATDENGTGELLECVSSNNTVSIQLQSLLKQAEGQHVTVTQQLARNQAGGTDVVVTLNNNSIVRSESGNVVVRLYDARGNVIAAQQSYAPGGELVALDPEERRTLTFSFAQPGVRAEVVYGDLVLDSSDATLAALTLSGLATLADFVLQADGSCAASVEASRTSTTVTAMTADPNAAVTVNGQPLPLEGLTVALVQGENVLTIEVTAQDGTKTVYVLAVQNSYPSSGGSSNVSYPVSAAEDTEHGTFTVRPDRAVTGAVVTITAVPDEGYKVGAVTVTRTNGGAVAVTSEGGGVYTFVMPRSGVTVEVTFAPEDAWMNPFADVPAGAWYYDAVQYVSEHGLMAGTGGGLFSPDATLTRAMLVQILWAMEDRPQVNYLMQYGDVAQDAWYAEAVRWAAGIGIVTGYSDSAFGPSDPLTRQQLALILYGYARHKGYDLTARADLEGYADLDQAAPYALEALKWAAAEGLISGTGDAALSPGGSATRAQVAVILTRFCQNLAG